MLYHLSGVLMGNLLAVLASVAASVWPKFDHTRDEGIRALTPMMGAVARNLDATECRRAWRAPTLAVTSGRSESTWRP